MNVIKLRLYFSIFIVIVAFLYSNYSYSQNITFQLLDSITIQPVSDANVIYSFTDDINSGSQYGFSDSNGLFLIQNVPDTIKAISIQIFQLNYKSLKLTLFKEDWHKEIIQIQLSPKTHQLGEIRIVGKAIDVSNEPDTITVVVDSLKTLSTPGIKDVLLKIDKLTINENSITYDGKIISKVFVDGVDLTGGSYMTLVDALNSNIIEEIDIVKNFHRNPILKDFETPETIINLRSDNKVPIKVSGDGRLGVADKGLLNLDLNLVGITPRLKYLARFTKTNIAGGVYQPSDPSIDNEIQSTSIGNTVGTFNDFVTFAPIQEKMYRVERDIIGGTVSIGGKIGENWVFRSSSYMQESKFENHYNSGSLNYLPDTTYLYSAIYYSNMRNKFLRSEFETEFSNDQVFFNFKLDGDIPSADNFTSASFSGQLMDSLGNRIRLNNAFLP